MICFQNRSKYLIIVVIFGRMNRYNLYIISSYGRKLLYANNSDYLNTFKIYNGFLL